MKLHFLLQRGLVAAGLFFFATVSGAELQLDYLGFNRVEIGKSGSGLLKRKVLSGALPQHGFAAEDLAGRLIAKEARLPFTDEVPASFAEVTYRYTLATTTGEVIATVDSSPVAWSEHLLPRLILPERPEWLALYRKAWELTCRRIVSSTALPARFAYNDYPDSGTTYAWDSCFCSLFQRYAAVSGAHPGMATLDNFYAQETADGYICRNYKCATFTASAKLSKETPSLNGINPPLFAWAEWNYYLASADRARLQRVLPALTKHYAFIEKFLQTEPGRYVWDGNGSGWDNILEVEKHKFWVELPAMQALAARHLALIAGVVGDETTRDHFQHELELKRQQLEAYWDADKKWYCSLDANGRFTGKTLSGMWPILAGVVPPDRLKTIVAENIMNPHRFLTQPMPLPTIAKDEPGYNPQGAYWHGSVWINLSLVTIRALDEQGYHDEAFELSTRTLDGIARVYREWTPQPDTLWECYAPEFAAPASHKVKPELGTVRSEFGGWTDGLINLLIEQAIGLHVDAPANTIAWATRLDEEQGVENLRFGKVTASLHKKGTTVSVTADAPFRLSVTFHGQTHEFPILTGTHDYDLAR